MKYFKARTRSVEDAEDLTQEVFVRLLNCGSSIDIRSEKAYAFQVAGSVLIDWLRRNRARRAGAHAPITDVVPDDNEIGCERNMLARERLDCVSQGLMELCEKTRSILVLRRLEGKKNAEIARSMGVSVSTVEKHVRHATDHLRYYLEERL